MNGIRIICPLSSIFAAAITYIFGEWSPMLTLLCVVVITDYITGIAAAVYKKELNSRIGFIGILKKVLIFVVVAFASAFDRFLPVTHNAIKAAVCMFYIANEALSVTENIGTLGIPLPKALRDAVEKLKKE